MIGFSEKLEISDLYSKSKGLLTLRALSVILRLAYLLDWIGTTHPQIFFFSSFISSWLRNFSIRCKKKFCRRYPIIVMEKMPGGDLFDVLKVKSDHHEVFSGKSVPDEYSHFRRKQGISFSQKEMPQLFSEVSWKQCMKFMKRLKQLAAT